jgi:hypothetical protein
VRLLNDAVEHLRRYEVLGLSSNKQGQQEVIVEEEPVVSPQSTPTIAVIQQVIHYFIKRYNQKSLNKDQGRSSHFQNNPCLQVIRYKGDQDVQHDMSLHLDKKYLNLILWKNLVEIMYLITGSESK